VRSYGVETIGGRRRSHHDRCHSPQNLGRIVVAFAVTAPFAAATHLLTVTIARHWPFAAIGHPVEVVDGQPDCDAATQSNHRLLNWNRDGTVFDAI